MDKIDLLDNLEEIEKIDRSGLLSVVADFPQLLTEARKLSQAVELPPLKKVNKIVITGLGGSAIAGDIISGLVFNRLSCPLIVNKGYHLPACVDRETLCFVLSYSGDTEETLSAVKEAVKKEAKIICVTSGGKLKALAESQGSPLYLIPNGYQPRAALPFLLVPVLKSLEALGFVTGLMEELNEAIAVLQELKAEYEVGKPLRYNTVKQLAKKMTGKIPVIMTSLNTTAAAGYRLKTQLNENSKMSAIFNVFPELTHNEIVNLFALNREGHSFSAILLRDDSDSERMKKRIEITKSLIGRQLGGITEISGQGKSALAKILSLIYFADFLSVYLAIAQEIDPTPVEVISRLKKEMAR